MASIIHKEISDLKQIEVVLDGKMNKKQINSILDPIEEEGFTGYWSENDLDAVVEELEDITLLLNKFSALPKKTRSKELYIEIKMVLKDRLDTLKIKRDSLYEEKKIDEATKFAASIDEGFENNPDLEIIFEHEDFL